MSGSRTERIGKSRWTGLGHCLGTSEIQGLHKVLELHEEWPS